MENNLILVALQLVLDHFRQLTEILLLPLKISKILLENRLLWQERQWRRLRALDLLCVSEDVLQLGQLLVLLRVDHLTPQASLDFFDLPVQLMFRELVYMIRQLSNQLLLGRSKQLQIVC